LEHQIEKKRLVKQGVIQRLLTAGKDWEVRTMRKIGVFKKKDILFTDSGETKAEIGKSFSVISLQRVYAGGGVIILRPLNANSTFLGYYLNSFPIQKYKAINGQGDAVVHIYSSGLSKIKIFLPPLSE
jgi:restriction endonuclease S subunit